MKMRNNKQGDGLYIYRRLRRWGATDAEVLMSLPGDNVAPKANYQNTLAITIDASPEQIWTWVVQMGQERAGFYTYTFLENLFFADMHNANQIEPKWQQRKVGDFVSTFRGKLGWKVAEIELNRTIVYRDDNNTSTLAVVINKLDNNHSRLITRMRDTTGNNPGIWLFKKMFWDWAHCVMQHGILEGIKARVGKRQSVD